MSQMLSLSPDWQELSPGVLQCPLDVGGTPLMLYGLEVTVDPATGDQFAEDTELQRMLTGLRELTGDDRFWLTEFDGRSFVVYAEPLGE